MINSIFLATLLISVNVLAGPRVIGNGGDVVEENPVSVAYIQNLIPDARLFILSWLHGLEGQIFPNVWSNDNSNPRHLPVPSGSNKLFKNGFAEPNIYKKISQIKINFKTKAPCDGGGSETDGSVTPDRPLEICISGFTLARKLNEGNAKIQLEGLIIHELSHLLGATENEAISIQSQYIEDMRVVSKESITKYVGKVLESLSGLKIYNIPKMAMVVSDESKLCPLIYDVRWQLDEAFKYSEITPISLFTVSDRDLADAIRILEGQALQLYVCGRNKERPVPAWVAEYEQGFSGKDLISYTDWMKNRGIKVRETTAELIIKKINTEEDLRQQINGLSYAIDGLQLALVSDLLKVFDLQLDEK